MQNRPKYNAKKTIIGNLKFDSKKEAEYYLKLKAKQWRNKLDKVTARIFDFKRIYIREWGAYKGYTLCS